MEKEVSRWLHQQLGYNAAADSTLSANCRGNLKSLWEFLMANYKSPENQRHIHNVLAKHRREQEAARQAPERAQQALQQRQHLAQLEAKAATLERSLASLQAAVHSSNQDAAEQSGEQGLFKQELHETQTQTLLLQAAAERIRRLTPQLQAKLSKLQTDTELAKARCQASGGSRRLQQVLQQLQQLSCAIRGELSEVLEGKVQQQQLQQGAGAPEQLDSARGTDQSISAAAFNVNGADTPRKKAAAAAGGAALQDGSGITALAGSSSSNTWDEQSKASAAGTAMELQPLARCGLVSGYVPSQGVQGTVMQLLQEAPELLLSCSSQLAAQASQELTAILDEAETALLAPLGWGSSAASAGQELSSASKAQQQGLLIAAADVAAAAAATCPYTLPWTIPWQTSISQQQQQSDKAAAFQSPEMLVKQRQQMHVQLYVQAKASAAAAAEAEVQLEQLMGAVPLLSGAAAGSWESQLAALWLRAEGLRAELAVLTQRKAEFEQDVDACIQAEAHLQEKWDLIKAAVREDAELNDLLYRVAADNMELYAGLHSQRDQARSLLLEQLAPTAAAASRSADAGRDELAREAGVVARLPVCGALPPQRLGAAAGGAGAASTTLATITRLQLASQQLSHLGRPTTAPKAFTAARLAGAAAPAAGAAGSGGRSSGSGVDAAAVSALRAACSVDAVAPVRCPAALLLEVADECRQLQQLQQQLDRLSSFCRGAAASAAQAADEAAQLQEQVEALRASDTQQVLPWLVELLEGEQQQRATKLREVSSDLQHFWEMPAQHLLPGTKHEGKSCSEWLQEIQALHGRKRELSSQTN